MSSRSNIAQHRTTRTHYLYVTGGDGRRSQVTEGGFRTRKEAAAAQLEALNAMQSGTWAQAGTSDRAGVPPGRVVADPAAAALEATTYSSYSQYVRLHLVPYIGRIRLQLLTPTDLNAMHRKLLDKGRRPIPPAREHPPELAAPVDRLRHSGRSWRASGQPDLRSTRMKIARYGDPRHQSCSLGSRSHGAVRSNDRKSSWIEGEMGGRLT